jgi:choline dehydrogenase-like flavoprotein
MLKSRVGAGDAAGLAEVFVAAAQHQLGRHRVEAMAAIERPMHVRAEIARRVGQCQAEQILGARHQQLEVEPLGQPAGEADMVGMVMGHDQPGEPAMGKRAGERRLP